MVVWYITFGYEHYIQTSDDSLEEENLLSYAQNPKKEHPSECVWIVPGTLGIE